MWAPKLGVRPKQKSHDSNIIIMMNEKYRRKKITFALSIIYAFVWTEVNL